MKLKIFNGYNCYFIRNKKEKDVWKVWQKKL